MEKKNQSSVISFPSSGKLYRMINFPIRHGHCGGSLVQFQAGDELENALPFEIGKVLVSSGMNPGDVRGNHAHYETEEIVVALSGGCTFELDDGRGTSERVRLFASSEDGGRKTEDGTDRGQMTDGRRQPSVLGSQSSNSGSQSFASRGPSPVLSHRSSDIKEALLLYPHIWRTFYDFEPGTVLLVVANIKYDEVDYIRDRAEFERISKGWKNLGGSAER